MTPFQQPQPPMAPMMGQDPMMGQQPMMGQEEAAEGEYQEQNEAPEEEQTEKLMDFALREANLAKRYAGKTKGQELLDSMGQKIYEGYTSDEQSRKEWLDRNKEWIKLATLVREQKTFPWPNASNVKYPLIATAAMQFAARAYPSLVPSDGQAVKAKVIGRDQDGSRSERAIRVAKHMSYQVMYRMPNWEEDMDRLCMINPILGVSFKKTYCDLAENTQRSELVLPQNLCINYYAKDLESAYRKTELLYYTRNEVLEKIRNDEEFIKECEDYLDISPSTPMKPDKKEGSADSVTKMTPPAANDAATPHVFLACHTFWDLDEDGYEEPYIITIHHNSQKVVRITPRWAQDGVKKNDDGKIRKIVPIEYFTKFGFIPNPESAIYDMGFGILLGEINAAVDTLINQIIDAGTLANLQSGFLGKGLRIKMGAVGFRPGEWKIVNASGEEIKNGIVPLPSKEPSAVLFQLLQMLITSGNQLASIAEIMVGKMPGQNTPATTTQETVEQGMKVFTAIYKRFFRSLYKEYKKLYELNRIYPSVLEDENSVLNEQLQASDYDGPVDDIVPGADPSGDSMTSKMMKNQQVLQFVQMGTVDPMKFTLRMMTDLEIPNPQELLPQGPPPPSPEEKKAQMEMQMMQQEGANKQAEAAQKLQLQKELNQMKLAMEQQKMAIEEQKNNMKMKQDMQQAQMDQMMAQIQNQIKVQESRVQLQTSQMQADQALQQQAATHQQGLQQAGDKHKMAMQQGEQAGKQKLQMQKQQAKMKPTNGRGKPTNSK